MKYFLIFIILLCSSCMNKKALFTQQEQMRSDRSFLSSANLNLSEPLSQPLSVMIGDNTTINGDILLVPTIPAPQKEIKVDEKEENKLKNEQVVDLKDQKSSYNPFTFILIGTGLLTIILALFLVYIWIKNTIVGRLASKSLDGAERALNSVINTVGEYRKDNLDENNDKLYRKIEQDILNKLKNLNEKRKS